jgi:hypothetical protein
VEKTKRIIANIRLFCSLLAITLLVAVPSAYAETTVGGVIAGDATWSAAQGPYLVTGDVSVENGARLTVEAGVTVRFQAGRRLTVQNGALRTTGSAADPVIFTSTADISGGTPAAGDWGGITFLDGTVDAVTVLDHLVIKYGSTTSLYGASPIFNNCSFEHNSGYALSIDLAAFPHGSGNSAFGNGTDAIKVPAGEIAISGAWDLKGIPYFLEGVVSVGRAPTVSGISPANLEQGSTVDAVISGTRLDGVRKITFTDPGVSAVIRPGGTATALPVQLTVDPAVPLGSVGMTLVLAAGDASSVNAITIIPPTPSITSVAPDRIYVSRPAATIDVAGRNFTAESSVFLDGVRLVTTYVSETLLRAVVPTQQLAVASSLQVKNPDPRTAGSFIGSNSAGFTAELPRFVLNPAAFTVRQGETPASPNLTISIPFAAPAGGLAVTLTSTNPAAATVPATITIPEGVTSAAITVTAPDTPNTHDVAVEVHANQNNWLGTKTTITVRPEPTVNLSPVTLLSGQGFTFFLSAHLTDPAPTGGLVVALSVDPANILTLPASITIPEGATQAQVTVANTGIGVATISATPAAGLGYVAGDSCTVTVRPIQTTNVTPLLSPPVGVTLATATPQNSRDVTYAPLISRPVGVAFGPVITGLVPDRAAFGTQNLLVRVNGRGLAADSSVSISPAMISAALPSGVLLRSDPLVVAADGSYVEFRVDIAADAPVTDRIVTVTSNGKAVPPVTPEANRFTVTWPTPELWSLGVNSAAVNTTISLQLSGKYFQGATAIAFEPPQGIVIGSPVSISADGTTATVPVYISPEATPGDRVVWISAPGGSTAKTVQVGNVFKVLAVPGATYTPVVSVPVGVTVTPLSPPNSRDTTYSPLVSRPVGISLGSVITGVAPISGAIGTTALRLRVNGNGLSAVDSFTIEPASGLSITRPDPPVAADGSWAEALVTIAADAPLTPRVIILKAGAAVIPAASAEANRFRVTLPVPELTSIFPNQREVGSTFAFTVSGRLLSGATAISFTPPEGITVSAPAVSSDGTSATVTVVIAAGAAVGQRIVTITTPGGTTSSAASINAFTITALPGSTYTPLVSTAVGVKVQTPAPPVDQSVNYGPVVSGAVGVTVEFTQTSPPKTDTYSPIISRPVGVAVGAVMTGMSPATIEPGSTRTVVFTGSGLGGVTSLQILPNDGLTIGAFAASADGSSLTVDVAADAAASRSPRVAVLKTAAGSVASPVARSTLLYVGIKPEITSLAPSLRTVGETFVLTVNGNNLDGATAVRFEPPVGITVVNPPVINATGNIATVTVIIDGAAEGSQRIVIIEGPYGSSGNVSGANNTFTVYRPVTGASATAPSDSRMAARQRNRSTVPAAAADDPAALLSQVLYTSEAIPVSRKPYEYRAADAEGVSWFDTGMDSSITEVRVEQESALEMLAKVGWGYRAPPS